MATMYPRRPAGRRGARAPDAEVLPDADPEEQYNFALGRAMQNDLETAEAAFAEFREFNKGHPREADALFCLAASSSFANSLIWRR